MSCIEGSISGSMLFAEVEADARALLPGEKVADLFCGAGGWGEGAKLLGIGVDYAINHWDRAIHTHAANNPACRHHLGDAWKARPRDVIGKGTKLGLLLASAACTTHSRAKGSAPVSKRVHMLGWCIARWMEEVRPRCVEIENVPEWVDWGPLVVKKHRNGRPVKDEQGRVVRWQDPARKGQHFRRWLRYCKGLGYQVEMRVVDAADFGEASRRKRLFVKARRDGQPIVWPEVTHGRAARDCGEHGGHEDAAREGSEARQRAVGDSHRHAVRGRAGLGAKRGGQASREVDERGTPNRSGLLPHRSAAEIIDWSDLGSSIFEREQRGGRPLKPKTLARIAEGIRRFVLNDPQPFVLRVTQTGEHAGWKVWPVDQPMPTQTTRQDIGVCVPIVAPQNSGVFGQRIDQAGPAITTKGHQALVSAMLATTGYGERAGQRPRVNDIRDPLNGVVAQNIKQGLVSPMFAPAGGPRCGPSSARDPLGTVLTRDHRALFAPVMACLRNNVAPTGMRDPIPGLCAGGTHHALCAALLLEYYGNTASAKRGDGSLGCVTTLDRHALVTVLIEGVEWVMVDILFRMLRPHELAAAMGFPPEYQWPASQRDATRLIGNAVSVRTAQAMIGATFPGTGERRRVEVAA